MRNPPMRCHGRKMANMHKFIAHSIDDMSYGRRDPGLSRSLVVAQMCRILGHVPLSSVAEVSRKVMQLYTGLQHTDILIFRSTTNIDCMQNSHSR